MHSTNNLQDGYWGGGKRIKNSIKKHGKESHIKEIIEFCSDRDSLEKREREIVNIELINDSQCMNIALGGSGGFPLYCIQGETHKQFSELGGIAMRNKILYDPVYAEKHSRSSSKIMSNLHKDKKIKYDTFKGKSHSSEAKEKMSKADRTGNKNSQFGTVWINNGIIEKKIKSEDLVVHSEHEWKRGRIKKS